MLKPSEGLTGQDKRDIKGLFKSATILAVGGTILGFGAGTAMELLTRIPHGSLSVPWALTGFSLGGASGAALEGLSRILKKAK